MKKFYGLILIALFAQLVAVAKDPNFKKIGKKKVSASSNLKLKTAATTTMVVPQVEANFYWDEEAGEYYYSSSTKLTYDNQGNVIRRASYYDGSDTTSITTYTYNSNGDQTSYVGQQYDYMSDAWVYTFKSTYTYDSKGNETEYYSYSWKNNAWELTSGYKTNYTYDGYGRTTEDQSQKYNSGTKVWENESKETYVYVGTNEAFSEITTFTWDGTQWVQEDRYYDIVWQNFAEELPKSYSFDEDGVVGRSSIVYTGSNYVETKEVYASGLWSFSERYSETTDGAGNTTSLDEEYGPSGWEIQNKYIDLVDSHGKSAGYEEYNIDGESGELVMTNFSHVTNAYDVNGNLISVERENDNGSGSIYKTMIQYSGFKSITVTSIAAPTVELVAAYPNPTKDMVTLDNLGLENKFIKVYNAQNNEVISVETMDNNVLLNLTNLSEGLYILKAQTASGKILTAKIVKQ